MSGRPNLASQRLVIVNCAALQISDDSVVELLKPTCLSVVVALLQLVDLALETVMYILSFCTVCCGRPDHVC